MCRTFRLLCDTDMPLERFVAQCRRYVLADLAVGALYAYSACALLLVARGGAQRVELGVLALVVAGMYALDAALLARVTTSWRARAASGRPGARVAWHLNTGANCATLAVNAAYYAVELRAGRFANGYVLCAYVLVLLYKAAKVYVMRALARRVSAEGAQVGAGYAGIQGSSV